MRILLCTKRDVHGCQFANELFARLAALPLASAATAGEADEAQSGGAPVQWVGLWLSDKVRPAEAQTPELAQLRFLERTLPMEMLLPLAERAGSPGLASFERLAQRHGIAAELVDGASGPQALARLRALQPDLVISARFSHIFDTAAIAAVRHGIVNVHPGWLPEYAGLFAPLRTLNDGHAELGCTVHWVEPRIDGGPVLARLSRPFERTRGLLPQIGALYRLALPVLQDVVLACARGQRPPGAPQDHARRRYRSLPAAEDFAALRARGIPLWTDEDYAALLRELLPPAPEGGDV